MQRKWRLEQDEFTVAGGQEIDHLLVRVARLQALAHQNTQIVRERRIRVVDRLVLTNHAAQLLRECPCTCLERRIRDDLIGLYGQRGSRNKQSSDRHDGQSECPETFSHEHIRHSACASTALPRAGFGAPIRSRRSESESAPPNAMTTGPSQMSSTNGL